MSTIVHSQSKDSMTEFYDFLYSNNVRDFEKSKTFSDLKKEMEDGFDILSTKTSKFTDVTENKLKEILKKSTKDDFKKIILVFRIITYVSRMNMNTFFVSDLCVKGVFKLKIKTKNGKAEERQIEVNGVVQSLPKYDALIEMSRTKKNITNELLDFFLNRELIEKLKSFSSHDMGHVKKLSSILLKYSEKGAGAEKSGEEAEDIVKKKLKTWGLNENVHFNKNDEKLEDILKVKLKLLKNSKKISDNKYQNALNKLKSNKKSRKFDLVFSPTDPKVIVQTVFYTSNTGSEGKKKTNQNIDTSNYINNIIQENFKEIKNLLLLDGPGWIDMAGSFQKNQYLTDNFFQIRTVDTKLKKILNQTGLVFSIDIELAIFELYRLQKPHSVKEVVDFIYNKPNISASKTSIKEQNAEWFENKLDTEVLNLSQSRIAVVEKFLILEKLQYLKSNNDPQEFSIKIAAANSHLISDVDAYQELNPLINDRKKIEKILSEIEKEGTIITQKII